MGKIEVVLDPEQRINHIDMLLRLDGLSHVDEDPNAAYCPISLTSTPDVLKPVLKSRQDTLINNVLGPVGITAYDPNSAPFSPDLDLTTDPKDVYRVDSAKIAGARYFVGHNLLPSTGFGNEGEKAKQLNRMAVVLMDRGIRVSRMQPDRTIHLAYDRFADQTADFRGVFEMLQKFDPGMGIVDKRPILLGFEKSTGKVVNLELEVHKEFPRLKYVFDGTKPNIDLVATNPKVFKELRGK